MEDIMYGVGNVLGRQKSSLFLTKIFTSLDKLLKKLLIHDDSQQELQRKFEKICLDEHITNLYAPRIIARQVIFAKIILVFGNYNYIGNNKQNECLCFR